jgi:hypothetical protein
MNEKKEQMMPHEWALQLVTRGRINRLRDIFSYLKLILSLKYRKKSPKMEK